MIIFYLIASFKDPGIIRSLKLIRSPPVHSTEPQSIDFSNNPPFTEATRQKKLVEKLQEQSKEIEDDKSGPISISALGQNPVIESDEEQEPQGRVSVDVSPQQEESTIHIETRFCTRCTIEQPLRAKHCRYCDVCIAVYDHHCPWMNNCVGERNRFNFWWYLLFECTILNCSLYFLGECFEKDDKIVAWISENWLQLSTLIIIGFFDLMVTFLLFFHSYLIMSNKTTWEQLSWDKVSYLKEWPKKLGSPFSFGILRNIHFFCCRPLPKDYTMWSYPSKLPSA